MSPREIVTPAQPDAAPLWWQQTWALASLGNVLLWMALPPLAWGALGWLAPVPWIVIIGRQGMSTWRPYLALWLSSLAFLLASLYWLTLPHWATAFGWLALSFYLAFYLPVFVALARVAVHVLRISILVAAPVVWVGLELSKAHLLSGFAMGSLAHTQAPWPILLQISDLAGAYAVAFLILFVAACLARMLPCDGRPRAWWPAIAAVAAVAVTLAYGAWRLNQDTTTGGPTVALVQGSIDIEMKYDPNLAAAIFDEYFGLSRRAVAESARLDLIVWPETMFRHAWYVYDEGYRPAEDEDPPAELAADSRQAVANTVERLGVACLLGIDAIHDTAHGRRRFNSALAVDRDGEALGRYDKGHLVPFGEFVPFAEAFPWLYKLTPLPGGLNSGGPSPALWIGGVSYAVNICYENTIPHRIRAQVARLRAADDEPQVLVNLTNDGWFWGSSELDMHLACAVFRAIECRKPFLIAANTGFSAWIDSDGRVVAQGRRRATDLIVAQVELDRRHSPYLLVGDIPAGVCLLACVGLAAVGTLRPRQPPRPHPPSGKA